MTTEAKPRGKYFEDFEVGETMVSPARTVTSTDIVNFACLSGDFNDVHTNFEYCKTTQFGEPIAHGPLVYALMGGRSSLFFRSTTGGCSNPCCTVTPSGWSRLWSTKKRPANPKRVSSHFNENAAISAVRSFRKWKRRFFIAAVPDHRPVS